MDKIILDKVFKSYDIRGLIADELKPEFALILGKAFAQFVLEKNSDKSNLKIVLGRDGRHFSDLFYEEFTKGVISQGVSVTQMGLCSTDMQYLAIAKLNADGGCMITASHNPKDFNGFKLSLGGPKPIGTNEGLSRIKELMLAENFFDATNTGAVEKIDFLSQFVSFLLDFADKSLLAKFSKLNVVVDSANGMAGVYLEALLKELGISYTALNLDIDCTFPNHEANPMEEKNLVQIKKELKNKKYDLGIAFDGDADRAIILDGKGEAIPGNVLTAIIAKSILIKEKSLDKIKICADLRCGKLVQKVVEDNGGEFIRSKVGHTNIKKLMADEKIFFGGELSAHYYFKDFFYCDSGILAVIYFFNIFVAAQIRNPQLSVSEFANEFKLYSHSGEINFKVGDKGALINILKETYAGYKQDSLDGLSVHIDENTFFNVRKSGTENLLRLNVESKTPGRMAELIREVSNIILRS